MSDQKIEFLPYEEAVKIVAAIQEEEIFIRTTGVSSPFTTMKTKKSAGSTSSRLWKRWVRLKRVSARSRFRVIY